jgi:hypothetical protein
LMEDPGAVSWGRFTETRLCPRSSEQAGVDAGARWAHLGLTTPGQWEPSKVVSRKQCGVMCQMGGADSGGSEQL